MKEIIIPKKMKIKVSNHIDKYRHYVLESITPRLVIYRCLETNTLETWQKKDFIKITKERR